MLAAWLGLVASAAAAGEATAPELALPIDCRLGKDCFVQSYVDIEPGPGIADYACGVATYDGHKGTDIRLKSAAAAKVGVAVLAAADGVVKGRRDGVADVFASDGDHAQIQGRECGNGVVLDHGGGWETQYCHMRKGSVAVRRGQSVRRGERLGEVGYSGLADFAHVHIAVRHEGRPVDPFTAHELDGACLKDAASARGLWTAEAAAALAYRTDEILAAEISGRIPSPSELEHDDRRLAPAMPESDQLMVVARMIKVRAGDVVRLELTGPGGLHVNSGEKPLAKDKATFVTYAGLRRPAGVSRWPAGRYEGRITLERAGKVMEERTVVREM